MGWGREDVSASTASSIVWGKEYLVINPLSIPFCLLCSFPLNDSLVESGSLREPSGFEGKHNVRWHHGCCPPDPTGEETERPPGLQASRPPDLQASRPPGLRLPRRSRGPGAQSSGPNVRETQRPQGLRFLSQNPAQRFHNFTLIKKI